MLHKFPSMVNVENEAERLQGVIHRPAGLLLHELLQIHHRDI